MEANEEDPQVRLALEQGVLEIITDEILAEEKLEQEQKDKETESEKEPAKEEPKEEVKEEIKMEEKQIITDTPSVPTMKEVVTIDNSKTMEELKKSAEEGEEDAK
jgi:hypothetical protein